MKVGDRNFGRNMSLLIIHKMTLDAVPNGGGVSSALDFLMDTKRVGASAKAAAEWAIQAIEALRAASDYTGSKDEEEIAGMILKERDKRLEHKRKE